MDARLGTFLTALERIRHSAPTSLVTSLHGLPEPDEQLSPWEAWTLIGLVRHRQRQLWVADIIRTRLQGTPNDLASRGAMGHPETIPQLGPVPGMPEWEYYFHGRGCCISHKVNGDAIDVDFYDDSAEYFDTFFYVQYLDSLRRLEPPERRLRELHPSTCGVTVAVTDLMAAGALVALPGRESHPYRLAEEVIAVIENVDSFCAAWPDPTRRLWLAALIGDWLAVDDVAASHPDVKAVTGPRAERCRKIRGQRLRQELAVKYKGADALHALADLHPKDLDECLEHVLSGPPSGLISAALDIICREDDPHWCSRVHELFCRVNPAGDLPQPHIWITSLKFLLRHGFNRAEVVASLTEAGRTEIGEAVLLALEHAPELALPLIRKGLLADVPIDRTQVAAILALVDSTWSREELLRALEASDDQEKTADVRAALKELGDAQLAQAVRDWEERNPHEDEVGSYVEIDGRQRGPFYSIKELSLKNRDTQIRHEMEQLHDRVIRLRHIVPPASPTLAQRPWWRFWSH